MTNDDALIAAKSIFFNSLERRYVGRARYTTLMYGRGEASGKLWMIEEENRGRLELRAFFF